MARLIPLAEMTLLPLFLPSPHLIKYIFPLHPSKTPGIPCKRKHTGSSPTLVSFVVIAESLLALYKVQRSSSLAVLDENNNYLHLQRPTIYAMLST